MSIAISINSQVLSIGPKKPHRSEKHYTLLDLCEHYGLSNTQTYEKSEELSAALIQQILPDKHVVQCESIPKAKYLSPLYSSNVEIPDNLIYASSFKKKALFIVEVDSSNYQSTVQKSLLGGVNLIRLAWYDNRLCTSITVFTFPSSSVKQVVTEIEICFTVSSIH